MIPSPSSIFKTGKVKIILNVINRSDLKKCSEFGDLTSLLKGMLGIPEMEELEVCWSTYTFDLADYEDKEKWYNFYKFFLNGYVPKKNPNFSYWKL